MPSYFLSGIIVIILTYRMNCIPHNIILLLNDLGIIQLARYLENSYYAIWIELLFRYSNNSGLLTSSL